MDFIFFMVFNIMFTTSYMMIMMSIFALTQNKQSLKARFFLSIGLGLIIGSSVSMSISRWDIINARIDKEVAYGEKFITGSKECKAKSDKCLDYLVYYGTEEQKTKLLKYYRKSK